MGGVGEVGLKEWGLWGKFGLGVVSSGLGVNK